MPQASAKSRSTVDVDEISLFDRLAENWWDEEGPARPLHAMNPVRLGFLSQHAARHFHRDPGDPRCLSGLDIVDIGCGGGLLSEPLARLGGRVTGLDASAEAIHVARGHAEANGLAEAAQLSYRQGAAEELAAEGAQFDIVTALEIVEHVQDLDSFLAAISTLLKPNGALFISTINRTPAAWLTAIFGAERLLKLLPAGTHHYDKLVKPVELARGLRRRGVNVQDTAGMRYDPIAKNWRLNHNFAVNYILFARRTVIYP